MEGKVVIFPEKSKFKGQYQVSTNNIIKIDDKNRQRLSKKQNIDIVV